jgi:8-oxo-dGTP pyrophosphatase MutT (NUDIX family)
MGIRQIPTSKKVVKAKHAVRVQYGALPYRFTKSGAPEILLVTTRQTKRWIIPKGWPIKGLKPAKSAAREAYEEAGVRGSVFSFTKSAQTRMELLSHVTWGFSAAREAAEQDLAGIREASCSMA